MLDAISEYGVPLAIGGIMLGIGLNLKVYDFGRVFRKPKAILAGLTLQMLLLPALGFLLAWLWPLPPAYRVGIVLIAACPGGTASNLVTHLLKGRVALSISMTAFNSFLILFTIPLAISLSMNAFMAKEAEVALSFWNTFSKIFSTIIIPTALGMAVRHFFTSFSNTIKPSLRYILPSLLILIFILAVLDSFGKSATFDMDKIWLTSALVLLNLLTICLGYLIASWLKIDHEGSYTIAVEMGLQNSALALFIATKLVNSSDLTVAPVIYSSFSFLTTLGLVWLIKQRIGNPNQQPTTGQTG